MINVVVYGKNKYSILMKNLLENEYSNILLDNGGEAIKVVYFVAETDTAEDSIIENDIISMNAFAEKYLQGEIAAIVIPKEYYMQYNAIIQSLVKLQINVNDIYNGVRLYENIRNNKALISRLITPMLQDSYLSYLEYHVADHCNLNCKYCTHYSPLVKEPVFTDFNTFKKDISRLKEYIDDIGIIRILGGEPLLNPELSEYIAYTRRLYPEAIIYIVTNGLLIDRISEELIDSMKRNMAFFHISYYPPMEKKIETIKKFLLDKGIVYAMSPLIKGFNKTQILTENPDEDFFYSCFQATCTCIHQGKIAPCYAPFTTKYFNEAFDKNLPTDEGQDLYAEENTTESIKLKLLYPLERCKYCIEGKVYPWEIVGKNSKLSDWVEE